MDFLLCKNRIDFLIFLIDSQNFDTETIKEFKQLNTKFNNDCIDLLKNEIRIFKEYKVSPIFKLVESGLELVDLTIFLIQLGYYKKRYSDDFESVGPNANVALMNFHELEFFNSQNLNR